MTQPPAPSPCRACAAGHALSCERPDNVPGRCLPNWGPE